MADVYQAEDTVMGRQVAMKVLPPEFARDPERVARFEKEVRNLAALDHPNIVTIYDVGHDNGCHYYTMALLTGGDLKQRIHQGLSPAKSLEIVKKMAQALGYAHQKGMIHRDIKPENIMFDDKGRSYLTDLGIARSIGSGTRMTKTGMSIGTPHYMSPEQARGQSVDGRSDLYSLGVVFYEMLTGKVPYDAEETFAVGLMHINDPVPELPVSMASFQCFIDRLLAKNPNDRFPDALQLMNEITKESIQPRYESQISDTRIISHPKSIYNESMEARLAQKKGDKKKTKQIWGIVCAVAGFALGGPLGMIIGLIIFFLVRTVATRSDKLIDDHKIGETAEGRQDNL
jgi:serine/threonine protein kinase